MAGHTELRRCAQASSQGRAMRQRTDPAMFAILVYEDVEPIDVGATAGVFSMARRVLPGVTYCVLAQAKGPVRLAGGLTILADEDFRSTRQCDVILVTGGPGWQQQLGNAALLAFLRQQPAERLASVCTGALILAAAGVLRGRRATTRRLALGSEGAAPQQLLGNCDQVESVVAALVEDGGVVTGGGVALAIDTALYLLGRLYGEEAREEVARSIEYDRALAANHAFLGYR
jgi:transcriptional regulator GlxA family with amidase domain